MHKTAATTMLRDLADAHAQVRETMAEMEVLTSAPTGEQLQYTAARFQLSKANMARRSSFNAISVELARDASQQEVERIERAKAADRAMIAQSRAHIGR